MRVRASISLPNSRFALISIVFAVVTVSCAQDTIWNIRRDELVERIAHDLSSVLDEVDLDSVELHEISRAGPGAAYYSAYHMLDRGSETHFVSLLETEIEHGDGIWAEHAARDLVAYHLAAERYAEAEVVATRLTQSHASNPEYARFLVEAVYWQRRDVEVLKLLDELERMDLSPLSGTQRRELVLFRAAALARIGADGWKSAMLRLFVEQPPNDLHIRAFDFLRINELVGEFAEDEQLILRAISLHARSFDGDAASVLDDMEYRRDLLTPQLIRTVGDIYGDAYRAGAGVNRIADIRRFLERNGRMSADHTYAVAEALGFLYRRMGRYAEAAEQFDIAFAYADGAARQRMLWYSFDSVSRTSAERTLREIDRLVALWDGPAYFSDTLDRMITDMIRRGQWPLVAAFRRRLAGVAESYISARLDFLAACGVHHGFIPVSLVDDAEGRTAADTIRSLLTGIARTVPKDYRHRYYVILAAVSLGMRPELYLRGPADATAEPTTEPTTEPTDGASEWSNADVNALIEGYVRHGPVVRGYQKLRSMQPTPPELSAETVLLLSRALAEHELFEESMRAFDISRRISGEPADDAIVDLQFPRGFSAYVEDEARRSAINRYILYAVIREESYFNPEAVSHAGAVGLMQLMPATALDMAGRLELPRPILTDPGQNIRIGAAYISWLNGLMNHEGQAILAYNAGPGRVREWQRWFGELPDELFFEAVPARETRDYGRKILGAAAMYGLLYYDVRPADVVRRFFPAYDMYVRTPR